MFKKIKSEMKFRAPPLIFGETEGIIKVKYNKKRVTKLGYSLFIVRLYLF